MEPTPADMSLEVGPSLISIRGGFERQTKWTVTVKQGMAAADGLVMPQSISKEVHFLHLSPILAAPSYVAARGNWKPNLQHQNGQHGKRPDSGQAPDRQGCRQSSSGLSPPQRRRPGKTRIKQRHALHGRWSQARRSTTNLLSLTTHTTLLLHQISWDDILENNAQGLLFLSIDGDPRGMHSPYDRPKSTQAYIQVTDIGLAWKINKDAAFIYAYSCETGAPRQRYA